MFQDDFFNWWFVVSWPIRGGETGAIVPYYPCGILESRIDETIFGNICQIGPFLPKISFKHVIADYVGTVII